jgi:hypothetical protein
MYRLLIEAICVGIITVILYNIIAPFLKAKAKAKSRAYGKVCLVGNGPISEENRRFIASDECDTVVRFNDMKNAREGERCDLHVTRSNGNDYWGIINRPVVDFGKVPLLLIGRAKKPPPEDRRVVDVLERGVGLYNGCNGHKQPKKSLTSGAMVMSFFQEIPSVSIIHTFGMNFIHTTSFHDIKNEKTVHDVCCTKCIFHQTPTQTYLPVGCTAHGCARKNTKKF